MDQKDVQIMYCDLLRGVREFEKQAIKDEQGLELEGAFNPRAVPPRRLTFIHMNDKCDICNKRTHTTERTIAHRDGWLCCSICYEKKIPALLEFWYKPKEDVIALIGSEQVKVRRSSGTVEEGWVISDAAYFIIRKNEFCVRVAKPMPDCGTGIEKSVPLSELIELNA